MIRHLILKHAEDPTERDPVTIIARCYREVIESRFKAPEEKTTNLTLDDVNVTVTLDDEIATTERVAKRSRIESVTEEATLYDILSSSVIIHDYCRTFIDTTTDILTRTTVKQGDLTYTTIDVTLAYKVDEGRFNHIDFDDAKARREVSQLYISKLKEMFKQLFDESVDYLDNIEAELFLVNVIEAITNKMGFGTLYVTAAIKALGLLYDEIGDTVRRDHWKVETDKYMKALEDMRMKYSPNYSRNNCAET